MATLSQDLLNLSLELIQEFGESVTLTSLSNQTYSTELGMTVGGDNDQITGYGVLDEYKNEERDGEQITERDSKLFIALASFVPSVGDSLTVDSVNYRVMRVSKIRVEGQTVLYELQIRL